MDRDKVREEIAIIIHGGFRSDVKAGAMADDVLSLLAPVFEKAEKWERVEEINNTCDGCLFHINYSCYYDGGCPFAVVLYALTDKEAT